MHVFSLTQIFCFLTLILWFNFVSGKSGEVCFPFGSSEPTVDTPQLAQGRPGKIGPRGPPGAGEPGPPGRCACDPNEIDALRNEIKLRDGK